MVQFACVVLTAAICLLPLASGGSPSVGVRDIAGIRCVSNYLFGEKALDPDAWKRDLDRMKSCGLNAVWMVNVWAELQPSVEPERWDRGAIGRMRAICAAARERGMTVVLPVAYIGEGWGPKGVDAAVWPLIEKDRQAHLAYLRRIARETRGFGNVVYLLCTEEVLPATVLYKPNERPECVASFREWARQQNPDIAYWNGRWGTSYTWDTLAPADTAHRTRWQQWADHQRWDGWLMRRLLPPMAAALREGHPGCIIGFHDFLTPMGLDLTAADGGLPTPSPVDFYSIGYYYDRGHKDGLAGNLADLRTRVATAKRLYPALPLFCGELGLEVRLSPPEVREADEKLQVEFLRAAVSYLREQGAGFSLWSWRTHLKDEVATLALLRADGTEMPALTALRETWTRH